MCGIAGIIKFTHDPQPPHLHSSLKKMSQSIAHRGPDGQGQWLDPRPNHTIALLHRRLAIIDLPTGAQPMSNEDNSLHLVFNGEIYNHAELRNELKSAGHIFKTDHSDTEVLLHGYEQWGTDLPAKLTGMFAFALFDTKTDTLFMARDRMGQKPLFYATLEDGLVFASTIPSILAWPEVPRRLPREQIALYLQLGYLPAPQTIWRDISQLLPGSWIQLKKDVLTGNTYWKKNSPSEFHNSELIIQNSQQQLRSTLTSAVQSQLLSDVPLACFLSGGIDSSIIAALTQQLTGNINTISVGFAESSFDETHFAEQVAKKINSHHTRLEIAPTTDIIDTLKMLMQTSLGQPFADSSILPTYELSKAVKQLATVAISGDGADELFAGYDRYRAMQLLSRWSGVAKLAPKSLPFKSLAKKERYRRFAAAARAKILSERYTRLIEIFPLDLAEQLLGEGIMDYYPLPEEYNLPENPSPLRFSMLRDQSEYLPGDVLHKVDAASMAVALEVRSPFLDHHVVQLANALPDSALLHNGISKKILRETFAADLPPSILNRTKKGFAVPIGDWFKTTLQKPLTDLLFSKDSFTSTHLNKKVAEKILQEHLTGTRDHTHRLFALLMLELFNNEFHPILE